MANEDVNYGNGNMSIFEELLEDNGATGMIDPLDPENNLNPLDDFDRFQAGSKSTKTTENSGGYRELPTDIMDEGVNPDDEDLVSETLRARGIDPNSIKFENENGEIEEVAFNELSREEQLALLNSEEEIEEDDYDLDESEINAINFLRENNMTIEQLAQTIREKTIAELNAQPTTYSVDDFSDDELFLVDFKNKYGDDFTEDELLSELDKAKENEELFNRKVGKLRADYKSYEDEVAQEEAQAAQQQAEQEREEYIAKTVTIARSLNEMHETAELDDNDKNQILSFMFDQDGTGATKLAKALSDPETLYKVAWYIKHGDNVFKQIHQYYQGEINKLSKQVKQPRVPETVVKERKTQHTSQQRPKRIEDLF